MVNLYNQRLSPNLPYTPLLMLLERLRKMTPELYRLTEKYGAKQLRVFGSVARGEETPQSDVDLLVQLSRGYDLFAQRLPLANSLSKLLHRNVDLIPEHELSPHIRARVLAEAIDL
jgi:uncharacterized protein